MHCKLVAEKKEKNKKFWTTNRSTRGFHNEKQQKRNNHSIFVVMDAIICTPTVCHLFTTYHEYVSYSYDCHKIIITTRHQSAARIWFNLFCWRKKNNCINWVNAKKKWCHQKIIFGNITLNLLFWSCWIISMTFIES